MRVDPGQGHPLDAGDQKMALAAAFPWALKGTFAVIDQGLFAGAHFLVNVLLARWLPPAEYGAFALAYSVFLLLAAFHTAGFAEPMLVFGAGRYRGTFRRYFSLLLKGHAAISLPLGMVLGCIAALVGHWSSALVAHSLYVLAFTGPTLLLLWMVRRAFYVDFKPGWSALGGGFYLALVLGLSHELHRRGMLSPSVALAVMGTAAALTSLLLALRLNRHRDATTAELRGSDVLKSHWYYGRWSMASAAVAWIPSNIYYIALPLWGGLESAAPLRALANIINPPIHALFAVGSLLLPLLVRRRDSGGKRAMMKAMLAALGLYLLGTALYLALLWVFRAETFRVFYGGRYAEYGSWPLFVLGLFPLSVCVTLVLGVALMSLERPEKNFWSYVVAAIVAAVVGIPCTAMMGVTGAALGMLLANLSAAAAMWIFYRRTAWGHPSSEKFSLVCASLNKGANIAVMWEEQ